MTSRRVGESVYIWNETKGTVKTVGVVESISKDGFIHIRDLVSGEVIKTVTEGVHKSGTGPIMENLHDTLDEFNKVLKG